MVVYVVSCLDTNGEMFFNAVYRSKKDAVKRILFDYQEIYEANISMGDDDFPNKSEEIKKAMEEYEEYCLSENDTQYYINACELK
jgi:hypothetical protein